MLDKVEGIDEQKELQSTGERNVDLSGATGPAGAGVGHKKGINKINK